MLKKLWIKQFRNLEECVLEIHPSSTVCIWGNNNQGKTNFLEALFVLSNGAPPVEKVLEHTIQFEMTEAYLGADIHQGDDIYRLYVKLTSDGKRSIIINNVPIKSVQTLSKYVTSEYVSADVIRIFQESPEFRRRDLDRFIGAMEPEYLSVLKAYQKVMKQKNRYLKSQESCDNAVLRIFNQQLSEYGTILYTFRLSYIEQLEVTLKSIMTRVLPQFADTITMLYLTPRLVVTGDDDYKTVFKHQLEKDIDKERYQCSTLSGPHRDDFSIHINQKSLFSFFSRGINRCFAIGLKVAQLQLISEKTKTFPILLLDDTFAELDEEIKKALTMVLENRTQLIYTSVLPDDHHLFNHVMSFKMENGVLCREEIK